MLYSLNYNIIFISNVRKKSFFDITTEVILKRAIQSFYVLQPCYCLFAIWSVWKSVSVFWKPEHVRCEVFKWFGADWILSANGIDSDQIWRRDCPDSAIDDQEMEIKPRVSNAHNDHVIMCYAVMLD